MRFASGVKIENGKGRTEKLYHRGRGGHREEVRINVGFAEVAEKRGEEGERGWSDGGVAFP
jgi:hypothetical protein